MKSITECFDIIENQYGTKIPKADRDALKKRALAFTQEGYAPEVAAATSIERVISDLDDQKADIYAQAGLEPEAYKALRERLGEFGVKQPLKPFDPGPSLQEKGQAEMKALVSEGKVKEAAVVKQQLDLGDYDPGLVDPLFDPAMAGSAGYGAGFRIGAKGLGVLKSLISKKAHGRAVLSALVNMFGESVIGPAAATVEESNPELALLIAVGGGLFSGLTVENLAEKKILGLVQRIARKNPAAAAKNLPEEVWSKWKAEIAEKEALDVEIPAVKPEAKAAVTADIEPPTEKTGAWARTQKEITAERKPKKPTTRKPSRVTTLRGFIKQMGGINPGNFKGEVKNMPIGAKFMFKKDGMPLDVAEQNLRDEGWLGKDEDFLELLRTNTKAANRGKVAGEMETEKLDVNKTAQEKRFEKEMAHEPEEPPEGEWVTMKAEALPEGQELLIDIPGPKGWDRYKVVDSDPFGVTIEDGSRIELPAWTDVHVLKSTLEPKALAKKVAPEVKPEPKPEKPPELRALDKVKREKSSKFQDEDMFGPKKERDLFTAQSPAEVGGALLGGAAGGVDWDHYEETGEIKITPKGAAIGAAVGAAGVYRIRKGGDETWRKLKYRSARESRLGKMLPGRDEDLEKEMRGYKDLKRTHQRKTEDALSDAKAIAKELQEYAKTPLEQKRLKQVLEGGITVSGKQGKTESKMATKAREAQAVFRKLRTKLKDLQVMEHSQFDNLTRKTRADLRKRLRVEMPDSDAGAGKWYKYAEDIGAEDIPKGLDQAGIKDFAMDTNKFFHQRLWDHYHVGSSREYLPIYYNEYEGLTPAQRKAIRFEIEGLNEAMKKAGPDGRVELKELSEQLSGLLREKKKSLARLGVTTVPKGFLEMQDTADRINRFLANKSHEITRQDLADLVARLEKIAKRGRGGLKELRAGYRGMNVGFTQRRRDQSMEVQKLLGRIDNAPYLVAKGQATQGATVHKAEFYKALSENPEWTKAKTRGVEIPANYAHVPNEKKFGALAGKYVRDDIWSDLKDVEEMNHWFVKGWDKYLGFWKTIHTVWNPSTQMRNLHANVILAFLGDVMPMGPTYLRTAIQMIKKGNYWKEAKDWGLYRNSFVKAELHRLRDDLDEIRNPMTLKTWIKKAVDLPGRLYQGNEHFFKTAVFIKARRSFDMGVDAAARKAEQHMFDYGDIPDWVKHAKRWALPFFTFTYKAVPLAAEMAIKKPWKMGAIVAAMYGMEEFSRRSLGQSEEESEKERSLMPEWRKSKLLGVAGPYLHVKIPWPDRYGDTQTWDLSYTLPFGDLGEQWGQSGLPLGKILPQNPFMVTVGAWLLNRHPFTGKDIHTPELDRAFAEGASRYWSKHLLLAWQQLTHPLAPGGTNFNKLKTGFQNSFMGKDVRDWADRPVSFQNAVLSTLMGVKLSSTNMKKMREFEGRTREGIGRAASREMYLLRWEYKKNKIDKDEYERRRDKLKSLRNFIIKERPKL